MYHFYTVCPGLVCSVYMLFRAIGDHPTILIAMASHVFPEIRLPLHPCVLHVSPIDHQKAPIRRRGLDPCAEWGAGWLVG